MSTYFSKVIKAGERLREFNFRQANAQEASRYSVDVPDDKGNRIMFSMVKEGEAWATAAQLLPDWIYNHQDALGKAIEENIQMERERKR